MFQKIKKTTQHAFLACLIFWVISLVFPTALFFKVWTGVLLLIIYLVFFSGAKWVGGSPKTFPNMGSGPIFAANQMESIEDQMIVPYDM